MNTKIKKRRVRKVKTKEEDKVLSYEEMKGLIEGGVGYYSTDDKKICSQALKDYLKNIVAEYNSIPILDRKDTLHEVLIIIINKLKNIIKTENIEENIKRFNNLKTYIFDTYNKRILLEKNLYINDIIIGKENINPFNCINENDDDTIKNIIEYIKTLSIEEKTKLSSVPSLPLLPQNIPTIPQTPPLPKLLNKEEYIEKIKHAIKQIKSIWSNDELKEKRNNLKILTYLLYFKINEQQLPSVYPNELTETQKSNIKALNIFITYLQNISYLPITVLDSAGIEKSISDLEVKDKDKLAIIDEIINNKQEFLNSYKIVKKQDGGITNITIEPKPEKSGEIKLTPIVIKSNISTKEDLNQEDLDELNTENNLDKNSEKTELENPILQSVEISPTRGELLKTQAKGTGQLEYKPLLEGERPGRPRSRMVLPVLPPPPQEPEPSPQSPPSPEQSEELPKISEELEQELDKFRELKNGVPPETLKKIAFIINEQVKDGVITEQVAKEQLDDLASLPERLRNRNKRQEALKELPELAKLKIDGNPIISEEDADKLTELNEEDIGKFVIDLEEELTKSGKSLKDFMKILPKQEVLSGEEELPKDKEGLIQYLTELSGTEPDEFEKILSKPIEEIVKEIEIKEQQTPAEPPAPLSAPVAEPPAPAEPSAPIGEQQQLLAPLASSPAPSGTSRSLSPKQQATTEETRPSTASSVLPQPLDKFSKIDNPLSEGAVTNKKTGAISAFKQLQLSPISEESQEPQIKLLGDDELPGSPSKTDSEPDSDEETDSEPDSDEKQRYYSQTPPTKYTLPQQLPLSLESSSIPNVMDGASLKELQRTIQSLQTLVDKYPVLAQSLLLSGEKPGGPSKVSSSIGNINVPPGGLSRREALSKEVEQAIQPRSVALLNQAAMPTQIEAEVTLQYKEAFEVLQKVLSSLQTISASLPKQQDITEQASKVIGITSALAKLKEAVTPLSALKQDASPEERTAATAVVQKAQQDLEKTQEQAGKTKLDLTELNKLIGTLLNLTSSSTKEAQPTKEAIVKEVTSEIDTLNNKLKQLLQNLVKLSQNLDFNNKTDSTSALSQEQEQVINKDSIEALQTLLTKLTELTNKKSGVPSKKQSGVAQPLQEQGINKDSIIGLQTLIKNLIEIATKTNTVNGLTQKANSDITINNSKVISSLQNVIKALSTTSTKLPTVTDSAKGVIGSQYEFLQKIGKNIGENFKSFFSNEPKQPKEGDKVYDNKGTVIGIVRKDPNNADNADKLQVVEVINGKGTGNFIGIVNNEGKIVTNKNGETNKEIGTINPPSFANRISNLMKSVSKAQVFNIKKLKELEENTIEILKAIGPSSEFAKRAREKYDKLEYVYTTLCDKSEEECYKKKEEEIAKFEEKVEKVREGNADMKENDKKIGKDLAEFAGAIRPSFNPKEAPEFINSLNDSIKSIGVPFKFVMKGGGLDIFDGAIDELSGLNLDMSGGSSSGGSDIDYNEYNIKFDKYNGGAFDKMNDYLNQYNITYDQLNGGAPSRFDRNRRDDDEEDNEENDDNTEYKSELNKVKQDSNDNKSNTSTEATKLLEQIGEYKIRLYKVKQFIDNEVNPKFENYNRRVFQTVFKKSTEQLKYEPGDKDTPPVDKANVVGLYETIVDDENGKNRWLEEIKKKFTQNRNELQKLKEALLEICDLPAIKSLTVPPPGYKAAVKIAFDGNFSEPNKQRAGVITIFDNILKGIQTCFDEARSILKPLAKSFTNAKDSYDNAHGLKTSSLRNRNNFPHIFGFDGGGGDTDNINGKVEDAKNKAEEAEAEAKEKIKNVTQTQNYVTEFASNIINVDSAIQQIEQVFKKNSSPIMSAAATDPPGMFTNILNKYRNDAFTDGSILAAQKMEQSLKANNLLPRDVLKISSTDKAIFAFVTLFLRSLTLYITEYLIQNNQINTLNRSLVVFNIVYSALYVLLVFYVNIDIYKLRVIFNYINMNVNSSYIGMHLLIVYLISYGVYLIISYLNFPIRGLTNTAISDEDKAYLKYQLEIITMIIWLFILMMIAFM